MLRLKKNRVASKNMGAVVLSQAPIEHFPMSTIAEFPGAVKSEAQIYANLPVKKGGYRIWPADQRFPTQKALSKQIRAELGISSAKAWQESYRILKRMWFKSLPPEEQDAYLADEATARTLKDPAVRMAFWKQDAEGGAR
jgi:hypothetical protein